MGLAGNRVIVLRSYIRSSQPQRIREVGVTLDPVVASPASGEVGVSLDTVVASPA